MSPEEELAIGRKVGDGEFSNLRTYNLLFLIFFSHNNSADTQLCFRMHLPPVPTGVTQKRLSCQSLIKSFQAVSGKWGRCCSKSILILHKPLLCNQLAESCCFHLQLRKAQTKFYFQNDLQYEILHETFLLLHENCSFQKYLHQVYQFYKIQQRVFRVML